MTTTPAFVRLGNRFMGGLLHSPLHPLLSRNLITIRVTGRNSGRVYTTPVNYVQDGRRLYVTSLRERQWWRNVRNGAPAVIRWRGRDVSVTAQVLEENEALLQELAHYLKLAPASARWLNSQLDAAGQPETTAMARFARERVIIILTLPEG
jgi:deazaflavin-dependent oxidoreductase (nitroreductase family)